MYFKTKIPANLAKDGDDCCTYSTHEAGRAQAADPTDTNPKTRKDRQTSAKDTYNTPKAATAQNTAPLTNNTRKHRRDT